MHTCKGNIQRAGRWVTPRDSRAVWHGPWPSRHALLLLPEYGHPGGMYGMQLDPMPWDTCPLGQLRMQLPPPRAPSGPPAGAPADPWHGSAPAADSSPFSPAQAVASSGTRHGAGSSGSGSGLQAAVARAGQPAPPQLHPGGLGDAWQRTHEASARVRCALNARTRRRCTGTCVQRLTCYAACTLQARLCLSLYGTQGRDAVAWRIIM